MELDLRSDEFRWSIVSLLAGMLATRLTLALFKQGWESATGTAPPLNPEQHGTTWSDALLWGIVSGVAVGVMRVVSRRAAASIWEDKLGRSLPHPEDEVA